MGKYKQYSSVKTAQSVSSCTDTGTDCAYSILRSCTYSKNCCNWDSGIHKNWKRHENMHEEYDRTGISHQLLPLHSMHRCMIFFVSIFCFPQYKQEFLTGDRGVEGKGLQTSELLPPGLLHTGAEDVLPGIELQKLDSPQQLIGFLQPLTGVFLKDSIKTNLALCEC